MRLERDNVFARVVSGTAEERSWIARVLRYDTRGARFSGRGGVPVFDIMNDRFPAGLLPDVGRAAQRDAVALELDDQRGPALTPACAPGDCGWLDDIQVAALTAALDYGRGILQLPTGAGKTELFLGLVGKVYPREPALLLAPRSILATQARERWAKRVADGFLPDEPLGLLADGERLPGRVVFATFQAAHRALTKGDRGFISFLERVRILVADECHTVAADTFFPVLQAAAEARSRLGLSATPLQRSDERSVLTIGALGPVIFKVSAPELVESGRLVEPTIDMHACRQVALRSHPRDLSPGRVCTGCNAIADEPCADDCATMDPRSGIFRRTYRELVVESTPRNELVVDLVATAERPVLAFVRELDHGKFLTTLLARRGLSVRLVTGAKSGKAREAAIKELRRGDVDVIVATSVFEAGVDIPELRTVVNAGAGASNIRTVQILGRVVRASEGKEVARMIDVLDLGEPSLERHARQRRRAYREQGFRVTEHGDQTPPPPASL